MPAPSPLIAALQKALAAHADPAKAGPMQAYMKSAMPFYGVAAPQWRRITTQVVAEHPCADTETLASTMLTLWRGARFREERYAAINLPVLGGMHPQLVNMSLLPALQEMMSTGAWWDHVDDISGNALARLLVRHPTELKPVLRRWAQGNDMWLRRAAIICQRKLRAPHFDAVLLYDTILPCIGKSPFAKEFFIRKGIGWALRERSYQAPEEVQAFCDEYAAQLAPLTVREALRVIRKRRNVTAEPT